MKKTRVYVVTLCAGILMVALSFLLQAQEQKAFAGVLIGVGAGLAGMSISNLFMKRYEKKNPDIARMTQIAYNDERNTMIRNKARAAAANITQWLIVALAYLMILIDAPLWAVFCAVGVFSAYHVLSLIFMGKYQKQM